MKIFIAGARSITSLDDNVQKKLMSIYNKNYNVFVGDCYGIDTAVQNFFMKLRYKNVTVYASNGKARNNVGSWKVENIHVNNSIKGFDFYKQKDETMAKNADYGFMVWDGKSRGTLNNIINLINDDKKVVVYISPFHKMLVIEKMSQLDNLIEHCPLSTKKTYRTLLSNNDIVNNIQLSLL